MDPIITADTLLADRGAYVVLDARSGDDAWARYQQGHLRGAYFADLEADLSGDTSRPELGGRHPLPALVDWCRTLGRWGITPDAKVVLYDDRGGINAAARGWWMLRAVGHESAWVLDGGLDAAVAAGAELERETPTFCEGDPYPAKEWTRATASADEVEAKLDDGFTLVDVRAPERYRGEVEPYDPTPGHIARATSLPCADNLERGRFKSPEVLREMYGELDPARTILSCGSGVTACHTLLALERAGLEGAALYVGSYSEWSRQGRPIEK